jgi:hypothetical protein
MDETKKESRFFASLKNDTRKRRHKKVSEQAFVVESRNPHLPAAAPAGLLSRKITGEVFGGGLLPYPF